MTTPGLQPGWAENIKPEASASGFFHCGINLFSAYTVPMDIIKLSQRADAAIAVGCLLAAAFFAHQGNNGWAVTMGVSAVVSGLSAKYQPGKWVLQRVLLARMK